MDVLPLHFVVGQVVLRRVARLVVLDNGLEVVIQHLAKLGRLKIGRLQAGFAIVVGKVVDSCHVVVTKRLGSRTEFTIPPVLEHQLRGEVNGVQVACERQRGRAAIKMRLEKTVELVMDHPVATNVRPAHHDLIALVSLEANRLDQDVASQVLVVERPDALRLEVRGRALQRAQHTQVVSNEVHVRHRDGVAVGTEHALRPRLWRLRTHGKVRALPGAHDEPRPSDGMLQPLVERANVVEVVDDLWAGETVPASENLHVGSGVLKGRADHLDGEGTHANEHDPLSSKRQVDVITREAAPNVAEELILAWILQVARRAQTAARAHGNHLSDHRKLPVPRTLSVEHPLVTSLVAMDGGDVRLEEHTLLQLHLLDGEAAVVEDLKVERVVRHDL